MHNRKQGEESTKLWSQNVPENVVEATLPEERKRQECIYELIYTEQDFVRDLEYVYNFWECPLRTKDIIEYNEEFVHDVFFNISEIRHVNTELSLALDARQAEKYLVSSIGDVMLEHVCNFEPFVRYGAHQVIGKFHFELEKKRNPLFAQFVQETERKPESRRLELNGYLTKPTTRLGRYNLLLREILKRTPDDNPDKEIIPQIMEIITRYLTQVNIEAGKCENSFNLEEIRKRLHFRSPADSIDLKLDKPDRQLLMKGRMRRKANSIFESTDLQVFLFDHYLLFTKMKYEDHLEWYRVFRKPIPLQLLSIQVASSTTNTRQNRASYILPSISTTTTVSDQQPSKINNLSITFTHHGRKGSPPLTLYTTATSIQQIWVKKILDQKQLLNKNIFSILPLIQNHFLTTNRVNNTMMMEDGRILVAADQGVYITTTTIAAEKKNNAAMTRIIRIEKVSQIELMPESQLLVLADKTLWTFPLEILSQSVSQQRGRSVSQNTTFFHVVCVVKTNTLSPTTIRVLEPVIMDENKKAKSMFSLKRLVRGGPIGLKPYKDLYLPSEALSINLLKSKMCISSPKEIGVVDMKNLGVQALLDPEDEKLDFVINRQDVHPVTIYRIQFAKYLVCYNEFAFLVDQRGRFIRSSTRIDWEGTPDSFALSYPYLLAFEPDFIEIRNVHTVSLYV
ncbi:Dbl homology domain-containing protein [Mucor mucedo]|uniref:Dbl homology domain-containing protein n=1 Tax=Mucor mucedo TaxID=29922 RepID=UPI00221FA5D4|nr:Dbl homology domain-containing protein [Mucor mucedo]KAI7891474.1 Dbl homology domain-containing protein [Mucor mucedo]